MPTFKDILVQVVVDDLDENGEESCRPLEEWGVQRGRKSKKISAYIEAETGKSFRIRVRPKIPFPTKDAPTASYPSMRMDNLVPLIELNRNKANTYLHRQT